jgi:hypothetical protein
VLSVGKRRLYCSESSAQGPAEGGELDHVQLARSGRRFVVTASLYAQSCRKWHGARREFGLDGSYGEGFERAVAVVPRG